MKAFTYSKTSWPTGRVSYYIGRVVNGKAYRAALHFSPEQMAEMRGKVAGHIRDARANLRECIKRGWQ